MDKVVTVCYGRKREWSDRNDAIRFFADGVLECDGCEKARYANVLARLVMGMKECADY